MHTDAWTSLHALQPRQTAEWAPHCARASAPPRLLRGAEDPSPCRHRGHRYVFRFEARGRRKRDLFCPVSVRTRPVELYARLYRQVPNTGMCQIQAPTSTTTSAARLWRTRWASQRTAQSSTLHLASSRARCAHASNRRYAATRSLPASFNHSLPTTSASTRSHSASSRTR